MRHIYELFNPMAAEQGWDEESMLIHAVGFIREHDLTSHFRDYLIAIKDEENAEEESIRQAMDNADMEAEYHREEE